MICPVIAAYAYHTCQLPLDPLDCCIWWILTCIWWTLAWAQLQAAIKQSHACCAALLYGSRPRLLSKLHQQQLSQTLQPDMLRPCSVSQPLPYSSSVPCQLPCIIGVTPAKASSTAPDQHWGCRRGHLRSVFQRQLEDKAAQVAAQQGLQLRYSPEVLDFLVSKVRAVAVRLSAARMHAVVMVIIYVAALPAQIADAMASIKHIVASTVAHGAGHMGPAQLCGLDYVAPSGL